MGLSGFRLLVCYLNPDTASTDIWSHENTPRQEATGLGRMCTLDVLQSDSDPHGIRMNGLNLSQIAWVQIPLLPLNVRLWVNPRAGLCLCFLVCNMGMITAYRPVSLW